MLIQCGLKDKVQEIHLALWRETKYALLRLDRDGRMRMHQMKGVLQLLKDKYNITSTEITGYEAITGNAKDDDDGIKEHPGFKYIVSELKKKKGTIRSWTKGGGEEEDAISNKKGRCFLQRILGKDDVERMSKRNLIEKVRDLTVKLEAAEAIKEMYDALKTNIALLEAENSMRRGSSVPDDFMGVD